MKQFVYRIRVVEPLATSKLQGKFYICRNLMAGLRLFPSILRRYGYIGGVKSICKLLTKIRLYYCVISDDQIISDAWITLGWCRHYEVEKDSAVIGPVYTLEAYRGRGVARESMIRAINVLINNGTKRFYVDTSEKNASMQRVIRAVGFGQPIKSYERHPVMDE